MNAITTLLELRDQVDETLRSEADRHLSDGSLTAATAVEAARHNVNQALADALHVVGLNLRGDDAGRLVMVRAAVTQALLHDLEAAPDAGAAMLAVQAVRHARTLGVDVLERPLTDVLHAGQAVIADGGSHEAVAQAIVKALLG